MNIVQFNFQVLYNSILTNIENYLDTLDYENDIDYEIHQQIMTISFSKKNKIIISKQEYLKQIWIATKKNGYHFTYQSNNWICNRSKRHFWEILEEAFYLQSNIRLNFKDISK